MDRPNPADGVLWSSLGTLFEGDARTGSPVRGEMTEAEIRFFPVGNGAPKPDATPGPILTLCFSELTRIYPKLALFSAPSIVFESGDGSRHRYADNRLASGMPGKDALDQLVEMQAIVKRANPAISFTRS